MKPGLADLYRLRELRQRRALAARTAQGGRVRQIEEALHEAQTVEGVQAEAGRAARAAFLEALAQDGAGQAQAARERRRQTEHRQGTETLAARRAALEAQLVQERQREQHLLRELVRQQRRLDALGAPLAAAQRADLQRREERMNEALEIPRCS